MPCHPRCPFASDRVFESSAPAGLFSLQLYLTGETEQSQSRILYSAPIILPYSQESLSRRKRKRNHLFHLFRLGEKWIKKRVRIHTKNECRGSLRFPGIHFSIFFVFAVYKFLNLGKHSIVYKHRHRAPGSGFPNLPLRADGHIDSLRLLQI